MFNRCNRQVSLPSCFFVWLYRSISMTKVLKVLSAQIRKSACLLFLLGFYQKRERKELVQYLLAAQGCDLQMEGQTEISLCHD